MSTMSTMSTIAHVSFTTTHNVTFTAHNAPNAEWFNAKCECGCVMIDLYHRALVEDLVKRHAAVCDSDDRN